MKPNWYKTAKLVEKIDPNTAHLHPSEQKKAYPVCSWCGKFGTTESGTPEGGDYIYKSFDEMDPEEKQQYFRLKPFLERMNQGIASLKDKIGFTHGICPDCAQRAF